MKYPDQHWIRARELRLPVRNDMPENVLDLRNCTRGSHWSSNCRFVNQRRAGPRVREE